MDAENKNAPNDQEKVSAAEQLRREHFARKEQWKALPGNRYTGEELRQMGESLGPFTMHKRRTKIMHLD